MSTIDECWEWNGSRDGCGYGMKKISGKTHRTHRLAWAWANGCWDESGVEIPEGMCVLHKCHNPPCCNPDHLYLGTHQDNMDDMHKAGRGVFHKGESNGKSKLTADEVRQIRAASKTQEALAREFGVQPAAISKIRLGKLWKHV